MEEVRAKSPDEFGRIVAKPSDKTSNKDFLYEENINEQIDLLRQRMQLKERANKLHGLEAQECKKSGAASELVREVRYLRQELVKALGSEKQAVHNALRAHREFQLATFHQTNEAAKEWLTDRVFDVSKRLNMLLCMLKKKRDEIAESEREVNFLDKVLTDDIGNRWHAEHQKRSAMLEYEISNMKVKVEAASILHRKYQSIKHLLKQEQIAYYPTLRNLEIQYAAKQREFAEFAQLLKEAKAFQERAVKSLKKTEVVVLEKRRQRRKQLARLQAATRAVIQSQDQKRLQTVGGKHKMIAGTEWSASTETTDRNGISEKLYLMNVMAELDSYHDKAVRLLDAMRLRDISQVPARLRETAKNSVALGEEKRVKEEERNLLIKQRDQLSLIYNFLAYTGSKEFEDANFEKMKMEAAIEKTEKEIGATKLKSQKLAEIYVEIRLALLSIVTKLIPGYPKGRTDSAVIQVPFLLKAANEKISKLLAQIASLEVEITNAGYVPTPPEEQAFRFYASNPNALPTRFIRVETPTSKHAEDSDGEELDNYKVPTRWDIKVQSKKVESIGMLTKLINDNFR